MKHNKKPPLIRKQFLLTSRQNEFLQELARESKESEGFFVRKALEEYRLKHKHS